MRETKSRQAGFVLIAVYLVIALLVAFGGALMTYAVADVRASVRSQAGMQSLYLAEGGIDQAIAQLRQDYNWSSGYNNVSMGNTGSYSVQVGTVLGTRRVLTAQGQSNLLGTPVQRWVEAVVQSSIPPGFYDNVIWAAQNLDFRGNSYTVTGDVIHADLTPTTNTSHVTGTITYNAAANPLPRLNFQQLYNIAQGQNHIYDAARLGNGHNVFPTSFWYTPPTDPNDPTTGVPNINYITTDLVLNGNIGTIGGFFVVVGNVLTDPDATDSTTINGNGEVAGAIYSTGDFRVNGGGNGLNVDGGIWAGDEARLNGKVTMTYNANYMNAIKALQLNADVQVVSWRDLS